MQADLSLRWVHISEGTFSDVAAPLDLIFLSIPVGVDTQQNVIKFARLGACIL